ncbi:DUF1801 domain-containing protein [Chitinophaga sp. Ak27]|uniref:DUF1801 domain-containing protein n=1 Tax=Chitinophaga sp. Ak27 TaxID=2726116 RepID=UPI00145E32B6|nr:DUF1801 domain-containing protein [Chitinophaga sp. Ak27]NLU93432.1 DUF1801 domain-containing protein [Chitinophaga sp. Ak27]
MNPEITQYIEKLSPWQVTVSDTLRKMILKAIPDAEERLQYGKPHYLKNGQYAAVIAAAKAKVSFMIFNAGELPEVKGYFAPTTSPDRKIATITEGLAVDYKQLETWLKKASKSL